MKTTKARPAYQKRNIPQGVSAIREGCQRQSAGKGLLETCEGVLAMRNLLRRFKAWREELRRKRLWVAEDELAKIRRLLERLDNRGWATQDDCASLLKRFTRGTHDLEDARIRIHQLEDERRRLIDELAFKKKARKRK